MTRKILRPNRIGLDQARPSLRGHPRGAMEIAPRPLARPNGLRGRLDHHRTPHARLANDATRNVPCLASPGRLTQNGTEQLRSTASLSLETTNFVANYLSNNHNNTINKDNVKFEDILDTRAMTPEARRIALECFREWELYQSPTDNLGHTSGEFNEKAPPSSSEESDDPSRQLPEPGDHPMFPGRPVDPEQFFKEHWEKFVPYGLTQALLRKRDGKLMKSLENRYKGNAAGLSKIIPSRSHGLDEAYLAQFGVPLPPKGTAERDSLLGAVRFRRAAQRKLGKV